MNSSLVKQWLTGAAGVAGAALLLLVSATVGAQDQTEKESAAAVTVTGTLEMVIVEDFKHNQAKPAYFIREHHNNRIHELDFKDAPKKSLRTGQQVTIKGHGKGHQLSVDALTADGSANSPPASGTGAASPPLDPERRTIVLLVDLQDAKASTRYTLDQITSLMYTGTRSVAELYSKASLGQFHFVADSNNDGKADVYGPFTIDDYAAQNCNYQHWADAAEAAAAQTIDLSRYQHRVFVLPHYTQLPRCGWAGIATIGCDPSSFCRAWIADGDSGIVYAHELGHNLNLAHAGTDTDNDGVINQIYGDYSDPMGSSLDWHLFNAPHVDQMNWYANYSGSIVTVTQSGTYDIAVLDATPPTDARILKLAKPDNQGFYYLSYRQPSGYDDSLLSVYTRGVNIHHYQGSGYYPTAFITSLADTDRFTDNASGIEVTQVSHTDNHATVNIKLCTAQNPTLTLAPSSSQAVQPGAALSYSVTVNNEDSAGCAATTFYLSYIGTGGGTLIPNSLSLQPGASGSATLQIATAGFASNTYPLQVQAADGDGVSPIHSAPGTASTTLVIDGERPTTPTGLQGFTSSQGIQLSWNAAMDALTGVHSYTVYRDDVLLQQTTVPSYIDTAITAGTIYHYKVTATDGVGNVSPFSLSIIVKSDDSTLNQCIAANPRVTLKPADQAVPRQGAVVDYTVTVDNQDSAACVPTTFTLSYAGAPVGAFPQATLTLAGGNSGLATLQVNTTLQDAVLAEGVYPLEVRVADEDHQETQHATVAANTTLIVDGTVPTTPTGLRGAPTPQGVVRLSWNAATDTLAGVESYTVYRDDQAIADSDGLTYTDAAVAVGATHRYAVAAVDKAGNLSSRSNSIEVFNGCEPANTAVTLTPSSQLVKAGASADYVVTVNNPDGGGCAPTILTLNYVGTAPARLESALLLLNSGQSVSTTLTVDTISQDAILADGSYTLRVQATDNDGMIPDHPAAGSGSATISVDGTPPTTPANLQGATDAEGNIKLSWNASTDTPAGVQVYQVYRDGVPLGETSGLSYTDTHTVLNVNYWYTIVAIDKVGNVAAPAAINLGHGCWIATPTLTLTPASLVVKKNAAASYQVTLINQDSGLRCQPTPFTLSYSGTATVTSTPTQLTLGTGQSSTATLQLNTAATGAFTLAVQATDTHSVSGHTPITASATAIVDSAAPTVPTGLQGAADAQGRITLLWNGSTDDLSGVQYYKVYRDGVMFDQASGPIYVDTSAVPGTTYKYAVSAIDRAGNVSAKSPAIDVFDGCSPKNPTVTLAPSTRAVLPGVTVSYTVTVSNQDNTACTTPTAFTLSYKGTPSGVLGTMLLTLAAGQRNTTTLQVNSTASGKFTLEVKAEDKDGVAPSHAGVTGKATFIADGIAPTTPTGLQATTDLSGSIQLSWSAATDTLSGVKDYTLYRNGGVLAQTAGLSYTDTQAVPGTTYRYTLKATDNLGNVSSAAAIELVSGCLVMNPTVTLTPLSGLPVKPGTPVDYEVTVSNQDGAQYCPATAFTLSYTGTPAANLAQTSLPLAGGQSGKTTLKVNTTGLASNDYALQVQAADSDNIVPSHVAITGSAVLNVDATPPTTPTGLQGAVTTPTGLEGTIDAQEQITLSWQAATDAVAGVDGYVVYRDENPLDQTTGLTYTDATAAPGIIYRYAVAAVDKVGNLSPPSAPLQMLLGCTTQSPRVTLTPSLQMVKKDVAANYTVTVSNQDGVNCPLTTFTLSYSGTPPGTLTPTTLRLGIGQSGSATLQVKTGSSASYTLQVSATDNDGTLPGHAVGADITTFVSDSVKPTTPTGLKATASPGQVALTWTGSTDTLSGCRAIPCIATMS